MSNSDSGPSSLNWPAIAALYAGLVLGIAWMLYWGDYRNATWLGLIGLGGACTAYGRILGRREHGEVGRRWQWAGALLYAVFFIWAGSVLLARL